MMERWGDVTHVPDVQAVSSGEELLGLRESVARVHVSETLKAYMLALVRGTRGLVGDPVKSGPDHPLSFGASPRASLALIQSVRALAWMRGLDHATPDLVQELLGDALRHRLGLTYEAEAEGLTADDVLRMLADRIAIPAEAAA
jgi:MoxR-like ATPase